jgi:hypothetical protein
MRHFSSGDSSVQVGEPHDARIPEELVPLLRTYVDALHTCFPERVYALSLYGSLALGDFARRVSDVDFLTVMVGPISEDEQTIIKALHQELLPADRWAARMDGEYAELEQIEAGEFDAPCLFVADGRLAGRRDVSKAGWLTLIQQGISVIGPEPAAFVPDVPWVDLEQEMWTNLYGYWLPKAESRWLFLSSTWVAFAVLTLCRIVYTMERHAVTSKSAAAAYAHDALPPQWNRLICEAERLRSGTPGSPLYRSRFTRAEETRRFMRAVVQLCEERFGRTDTGAARPPTPL